ncbi:hypothetical protein FAGAP_4188 [Fusarium agapanthi]|uniref:2EXR domain-containing protein n=1 Tax=Fusarium agapanthi TaxID=1803897 RepID=A0A9P5BE26_9HYPO|nr:hypothetical protein FAGAP_4188 [Fusarium agapanthi]
MEYSNQVKPSGELLSLLNHKFPNSDAIFHLFPRLPTELRLMIWERILTRERYIKVELCTMNKRTGKMHRAGIPFKSWRLTEPYGILLHHPPKRSALFSTSVESRASAQRFYRVALPCLYVTKSPSAIDSLEIRDQNTEHNPQGMALIHARPYGAKIPKRDRVLVPGTFVVNPELDTLEIDGVSMFANFANDVWDHDPRKVGKLPISDESGTVAHFKSQSEGRERRLRERRDRYQLHTWIHLEEATGQLNGAVETAIGFWAFPAEALVQFSRSQNLSDRQLGCFYDLSAAQPELCLFDL